MTAVTTYTPELTAQIAEAYKAGETVEALALTHGRSTRSIIAKLAQLGIYKAKTATKGAGKAITKAELIAKLAEQLGLEATTLTSLEKADKVALTALVAATLRQEQTQEV